MYKRINLSGLWKMSISNRFLKNIQVPSSYFGVGEASLEREIPRFDFEKGFQVFLCFEGIGNTGEVEINNVKVGTMLPFVPYKFNITSFLKEENILKVKIQDINAPFGYSKGWETYGGIIRDVFLEIKDEVFIEDIHIISDLSDDLSNAYCKVSISLCNLSGREKDVVVNGTLYYNGNPVLIDGSLKEKISCPPTGEIPYIFSIEFDVPNVNLWSVEDPHLYSFKVEVKDDNKLLDEMCTSIGFRRFEIKGRTFLLNGKPIFLKGVCRHDMWENQGYTLTREQMEKDMLSIKELGANFVRLVHYPHHKYIIELADKIGLMVTEEPGLWNLDLKEDKNKIIKENALKVMEKVAKRDRNSPSVIAWLLGNECHPDIEYLKRGKEICNTLDPTRPVSFSHIYTDPIEEGKKPFLEADLDFYDFHPYTFDTDRFKRVMEIFNDKPLVFGEWGGWFCRNNEGLMKMFGEVFVKASRFTEKDIYHLNGISYWEWADMRQYSRGYPGCEDGVLTEGLVEENRNRKPDYFVMKEIFKRIDSYEYTSSILDEIIKPEEIEKYEPMGEFLPLDLEGIIKSTSQKEMERKLRDNYIGLENTKFYLIGKIPTKIIKVPITLSLENREEIIPIGREVCMFHFFGQVSLNGCPSFGRFGEEIAEYIIEYEDGDRECIDLKNGVHFARSNLIYEGSRIEPIAFECPIVIKYIKNKDFAINSIRYFRYKPKKESTKVKNLYFRLTSGSDFYPFLYGITLEVR